MFMIIRNEKSMFVITSSKPPDKRGYPHSIYLFLHENICWWYSLRAPQRGASNEYHNICFHGGRGASNEYHQHMFSWRNKKNINIFSVEKSVLSGAMKQTRVWTLFQLNPGPSCLKLTMSLVNVSLKLWSLNTAYTLLFLLKKECE